MIVYTRVKNWVVGLLNGINTQYDLVGLSERAIATAWEAGFVYVVFAATPWGTFEWGKGLFLAVGSAVVSLGKNWFVQHRAIKEAS